ncbi:MAG: 23S rRNA (guanosine(2251)-2'-O)-methyltransferase RlmB [Bacteroidetes bacterium HGW-Bacteroidetes-13]|nr:MAG: 23S rRNA (guanosine(2251)-2'-O)-methyltransferase RlmB [Bacteroidetes bacterium HGW-Bacteroidetes-13]
MQKETQTIYGIRAIMEGLNAGKEIEKIYLKKGLQSELYKELTNLANRKSVSVSYVPEEKLYKLGDRNHQGAVAVVSEISYITIEKLLEQVAEKATPALLLLLDGVTDVRNFGAIARTAACVGADGIIIPKNGSAPVNADAIKTSAGALYSIPVCKVDHLKDAVFYLQSSDIKIIAATEKTNQKIYDLNLTESLAIIMGAEDKGVSESILKLADEKASLPITGNIASLNVSVACGAILYEVVRQRINLKMC